MALADRAVTLMDDPSLRLAPDAALSALPG
jgi:hypothetical protein